jgi:hypothetical protein
VKTKNLLILAAVVLAVAAYVFFFERHRPSSEDARREADAVLPGLERERVTGLRIERDGAVLRLAREGEAWRLVEPMEYPADEATVSSTLGSLANLKAERRLAAAGLEAAAYGLDPPAATISLSLDDGTELTLAVGDELPLGSTRALRRGGSDEIVIAPGWFMSDLERGLDDWRSREVVDLEADEVASITIEAGPDTIRALRSGEQWRLESPLEDLADRDHLQGLLSDLAALRIEEFLDSAASLEELGLTAPEYRLTIVPADGGEPFRLELGATRERDGGTEVACRRGGGGELFWAADRVRTRLSKAPVLWRSKKAWPFDSWEVEGLRLRNPSESVELEKVDFQWRIVGHGGEADQARVSDRLTALAGLEATGYDLLAPPTAEMGRAELVLAAAGEGGEGTTVSFSFFEPMNEGGQAMVVVSGREAGMGVDPAQARRIVGGLADLRELPQETAGDGPSDQTAADGE